jgi:hypothetical protein
MLLILLTLPPTALLLLKLLLAAAHAGKTNEELLGRRAPGRPLRKPGSSSPCYPLQQPGSSSRAAAGSSSSQQPADRPQSLYDAVWPESKP